MPLGKALVLCLMVLAAEVDNKEGLWDRQSRKVVCGAGWVWPVVTQLRIWK